MNCAECSRPVDPRTGYCQACGLWSLDTSMPGFPDARIPRAAPEPPPMPEEPAVFEPLLTSPFRQAPRRLPTTLAEALPPMANTMATAPPPSAAMRTPLPSAKVKQPLPAKASARPVAEVVVAGEAEAPAPETPDLASFAPPVEPPTVAAPPTASAPPPPAASPAAPPASAYWAPPRAADRADAPAPAQGAADIDPDAYDVDVTRMVPRRSKTSFWTLALPDGAVEVIVGSVIIGRAASPIPGRTGARVLTIDDPTRSVSKNHAIFADIDGDLYVEDLESMNGIGVTTPDGRVTDLVPGRPHRLEHGTRVELGDMLLTVHSN